jgi:imidazolonepropionase-like amidohydrolase
MHAIRAGQAFDGERFLRGGATVVVDGERIVGVEAFGYDVPDGVELQQYAGTVLPGLIDCHTHVIADCTAGGLERAATLSAGEVDEIVLDSLRAHVTSGVTTVRDLGVVRYRTLTARDLPGLPRVVAGAADHDAGRSLPLPGGRGAGKWGFGSARGGPGAGGARRRCGEGDGLRRVRYPR